MTFHHTAQILVVGNNTRNLTGQFTTLPAVENVGKAVGGLADKDHHTLQFIVITDAPLHPKRLSEMSKISPKRLKTNRQ